MDANLSYQDKDVNLTIQKGKHKIPLVKASTKFSKPDVFHIFVAKNDSEVSSKKFVSRCCELKKVEPFMGQTVRLALPFFDWPREGHIDCCEPREGILFESQLLTIKRNNPTKNAKHNKYCNQSRCIGSCPTKPYYFANAIVHPILYI